MGKREMIEQVINDAVNVPTTAPELEEAARRIQFIKDQLSDE